MKVTKMNSAKKNSIKTILSRALVVLLSYAMISSTSPAGYVAAYGLDETTDVAAEQTATTEETQATEAAPAETTPAETPAPAEEPAQAAPAQTETTIALNLGNGYITYYGQTIAAPTSSLSVPTDRDFTFAAAANGGYTLKAVYRTMGESETPIAANADGTYTLAASDFAAGVGIRIETEGAASEGAAATSLTSAQDALDQVLADSTETVYTYEDQYVSVTATLSDPHAVPDDADFVVTQVTPDTKDADGNPAYNYDAYMDALNGGETTDNSTYTADNTLLYDIAFMYPELGEDGQPTGKTIEFEPADGTVKIEIQYKQNQLSETGAEDNADISVTHLPLTDAVKEDVDTTADATSISKDDIKVEGTQNQTASVEGTQSTTFTTDSLSVFAVTGQPSTTVDSSKVQAYDPLTITDLVGNAVNYGITAETWYFNGEAETSFAVKTLTGMNGATLSGGQNGSNSSESAGAECQYIMVGYINGQTALKGYEAYITMPESEKGKLSNALDDGAQMHYTFDSKDSIDSQVGAMISAAATTSSALASRNSFANATVDADTDSAGHMTIDFTQLPDNATYYIDADNFGKKADRWNWNSSTNRVEVSRSAALIQSLLTNGGLIIKKNTNQRIVFNFAGTNVKVNKFTVIDGGTSYDSVTLANTTTKTMDTIEDIVFNMPNATSVNLEDAAGVFLAPKAEISMFGVGGGWSISKTMINNAEWHFTYDHVEKPDSKGFTLGKTVDGDPATVNGFSFSLYQQNGSDWDELQTKTNKGGTITFDKLTYDSGNCKGNKTTFIYKVVENGNDTVTLNGNDYNIDKTVYYIKVEVTKTQSGNTTTYTASDPQYYTDAKCTKKVSGTPTFNNTTVQNENGSLTINKKSVGKVTPDDATFTITGPGNYSKTVKYSEFTKSADSKTGSYTLTGLAAGEYTVTEDAKSAQIAKYKLTVSDNGVVTTQVAAGGESSVTLTNTYKKKTGEVSFGGTKSYDGQLSAGRFHFTATVVKVPGKTTVGIGDQYHTSNAADGTFSFVSIPVNNTGTYIFEVTEDSKTGDGIVYDGAKYTVTVKVEEGENALIGHVTSVKDANGNEVGKDGITFTNKDYTATGSLTLSGKKTLENKKLNADNASLFTYTAVEMEGDKPTGRTFHGTTDAKGKIAFKTIDYTLANAGHTYTYVVSEDNGGRTIDGVTYSRQTYIVTAKVTDNGDGTLNVEKSSNYEKLNFTNTYTAEGSLALSGKKTLENQGLNSDNARFFTYTVVESENGKPTDRTFHGTTDDKGNITFDSIGYTQKNAGHTYTYTVTENHGGDTVGSIKYSDKTYSFTVTVTDNDDGTLTLDRTGNDPQALNFTNTYEASGTVQLTVNKQLVGRTLNAEEFSFELKDAKGKPIETVKNAADGTVTFSEITYTKKSLKQAVEDGTATKNDDGSYTVTYTIDEVRGKDGDKGITYAKNTVTVTVAIEDDGNGNLTAIPSYSDDGKFKNTYSAEGSVTFKGEKSMEGRALTDSDVFSFTIQETSDWVAEADRYHGTASSKGATITYPTIDYKLKDVGLHTYTITETAPTQGGVTVKTSTRTVKVKVVDNGDGTLRAEKVEGFDYEAADFVNTYSAEGSLALSGKKTLEHKNLDATTAQLFTYTVRNEAGDAVSTGKTDTDGNITFGQINYTLKDAGKTYTYTVTEDVPAQAKNADGITYEDATAKQRAAGGFKLNGITYDGTVHTVKVKVVDNGDGTLTAQKVDGSDDFNAINFTNTYSATGKLELKGEKTMEGRDLKDGDDFNYTVRDHVTGVPVATGSSDESGKITYTAITYSRADLLNEDGVTYAASKTYTYDVTEDETNVAGVTKSSVTHTIEVTIADDGQGHINVTHTGDDPKHLDFTNTYSASGSIMLEGTKTLTGRAMTAGEFTFQVTETVNGEAKVVSTGTNDADGTITFAPINYSAAGDHDYTVSEVTPTQGGVTAKTQPYSIHVHVVDDLDGTLTATRTDDAGDLTFTNEYASSNKLSISGVKKITGREFVEGDSYTFTLTGKDGAPMPNGADKATNTATVTISPTSGSEVGFSFDAINYTQADAGKTYTYEVREQAGDAGGLTYDKTVKTVKVAVSDDGKGNLTAQIVRDESDAVEFTNTYGHDSTSIGLTGNKRLTGRDQKAGEFHFEVTETVNGKAKVVSTGANAADGTIVFTNISYDEVGEHDYTVSEVEPTQGGVTAQTQPYSIHVSVTDDNQGHLHATRTDSVGNLTFTNTYAASGKLELAGTKSMEGRNLAVTDVYSFTIDETTETVAEADRYHDTATNSGSTINYPTIEYTLADVGEHTYTVAEVAYDAAGVKSSGKTYTFTVKVSDNGDGTLKVEKTDDNDPEHLDFTNIYTAKGQLDLSGVKTLKKLDIKTTARLFTYTAVEQKDGKATGREIHGTTDEKGNITFPTINYTLRDAGHTYSYTVSEDHGGNTIDGITYDDTTYTVTVDVTDYGNGTLSVTPTSDSAAANGLNFTNTYAATGEVTFHGTKTYEGDKTGFTFTAVEQENGQATGRTFRGATDKDGNITFKTAKYTLANVGHTYTYTVTEDVPAQAKNAAGRTYADASTEEREEGGFVYEGITYDSTPQTVTVKVKDDVKDGQLEVTPSANAQALAFTNTYGAKGSITLEGTKTLTGRDMASGEFTFQVTETVDGVTKVVSTGKNDADGTITFAPISYTAAGEHDYVVSEVKPTQGGVTAGGESYEVHVSVEDNGHGTLTATRTDTAGDLAFTNTYAATGSVTFSGKKSFDSRDVRDSETFTFNVDETTEGVENPYSGTATSAGATISYPTIEYTLADVGEHTYHVTEADTTAGGVTKSTQSYDVTVTVADHGDGTLDVTTSDNADALNFTNTYKANGSVKLVGTKTLTGRDMTEGEFGFTVKDAADHTVTTGTNTAAADGQAGDITFNPITYTQDDMRDDQGNYVSAKDFTYTVEENAGTKGGVAYSTQSFRVTVHVVDKGDGTLTATATYPDGDLAFTNTYTSTDTPVTFGGTKTVENKNEANGDKDFTFQLVETDKDGNALEGVKPQTVTRTGAGDYRFATITYNEPGTHYYKISEVAGNDHGYSYDKTVYTETVTVADDGNGSLVAEVTGTTTDADGLDFTNTYKAEATDITLSAVKNLTGRDWKKGDTFNFQLTANEGTPMPADAGAIATASTTGDHKATFGSIHYTEPGTYEYNISELAPTGEGVIDNGDGIYILNGVTYDTNAVSVVKVAVEDHDGQLVATATYDGKKNLPEFTNAYSASEATATLEATKKLNGGDIADFDGDFSFTLTAGKNDANVTTPMPTAAGDADTLTVNNTGEAVSFGEIAYSAAGTYNYTITETQGEQGGVTYDEHEHTAKVVVEDDNNGALHATVTYDDVAATDDAPSPAPVFTNTYFAAKANISADKHYFGAGVGAFNFTLVKTDSSWNAIDDGTGTYASYGAGDTVVDEGQPFQITVSNGAYENGVAKVEFPAITYYEAGTYYYKLAETSEDATDASIYLVTVTVDADQHATATYQAVRSGQEIADATDTDAPAFYNNGYVAAAGRAMRMRAMRSAEHSVNVMPVVQKELDGATLEEGQFTFLLEGEDGSKITATNDADGTVAFAQKTNGGVDITSKGNGTIANGVLNFTKPGTYTYTISEVAGEDQLIKYDDSEITLTVTVKADAKGNLTATTSYEGATKTADDGTPVFMNKVKPMDLRTRKVSKVTGEPLPGATYGLWMANPGGEDVYLGNAVSDENGYLLFEDFQPEKNKKYYFKEEAAPAGHLVDPYRGVYMIFVRTDEGYDVLFEGTSDYEAYVSSHDVE